MLIAAALSISMLWWAQAKVAPKCSVVEYGVCCCFQFHLARSTTDVQWLSMARKSDNRISIDIEIRNQFVMNWNWIFRRKSSEFHSIEGSKVVVARICVHCIVWQRATVAGGSTPMYCAEFARGVRLCYICMCQQFSMCVLRAMGSVLCMNGKWNNIILDTEYANVRLVLCVWVCVRLCLHRNRLRVLTFQFVEKWIVTIHTRTCSAASRAGYTYTHIYAHKHM